MLPDELTWQGYHLAHIVAYYENMRNATLRRRREGVARLTHR